MITDRSVETHAGYRGPDRRRVGAATAPVQRWLLLVSAVAVVLLSASLVTWAPPEEAREALTITFDVAAALLAVTVGALALARSRWTGEAPLFWFGLGFCALGVSRLAFWVVVPFVDGALVTLEVIGALRLVGRAIALGAFLFALLGAEIDAGPRRGRATLLVVVPILGGLALFLAGPTGTDFLGQDPDVFLAPVSGTLQFAVTALLGLTWVALAITYILSGFRGRRPLLAWFGLCFATLSIGQAFSLPATLDPQLPVLNAAILRSVAFSCALIGIVSEMRRLYAVQGTVIQETSAAVAEAEAHIRFTAEILARERHDARNAVHVITTAVHTLERFQDALTAEDRRQLQQAVEQGIDRLRTVLASDEPAVEGADDAVS